MYSEKKNNQQTIMLIPITFTENKRIQCTVNVVDDSKLDFVAENL